MKALINKKTIGGMILTAGLLLCFFSKTIFYHNLPEVTAVKPTKGKLNKMETSSGISTYAETNTIYADEEGIAGDIFVKEGDHVKAGQELYRIDYDRDPVIQKLEESAGSREALRQTIDNYNQQIELSKQPNLEEIKLEQSLKEAETAYALSLELHGIGEASSQELTAAKNLVDNLNIELAQARTAAEGRTKTLQLERDAKLLELENLERSDQTHKKLLETYDNKSVITAATDGVIQSLNVTKGQAINKNEQILTMGVGNEYIVECPVSLNNNFIVPGDTCELTNSSRVLKGTVSNIIPSENEKKVRILVTAEEVTAGETFDVTFKKESETSYTLVPNGAVNQDSEGYYLNQVKRREGILGMEFYLERIAVYIGDSDSKNTVITQGITFFEPIMLNSSKAVASGDTILLKNAGDFFEE